jgi:hypothetical protein
VQTLTAYDLLALWDSCHVRPPNERAIAILESAWPGVEQETLSALDIVARDKRLMRVREAIFGTTFEGLVDCPACGVSTEVAFASESGDIGEHESDADPAELTICTGRFRVRARLPNSGDVRDALGETTPESARALLLTRCVLTATRSGAPVEVLDLPPDVVDRVESELEGAHARGACQLAITCPECGHRWDTELDVPSFLWREIDAWARRLMRDVHTLAGAYGWAERDVVCMGAHRRQFYLQLLGY